MLLKKLTFITLILFFANSNQQIVASQKYHGWTVKKAAYFGAKIALLGAAVYVAYTSSSGILERLKLTDFEANRKKIYNESYEHPWIALGATGLILYVGYYLVNSCLDDVKTHSD
jgi:hypothetical protein